MFHAPHSFSLKRKGREIFFSALFLFLFACTGQKEETQAGPSARWYKGNTHSHTVICGHADSSPEAVARWYHDRGYNFLILSEHNHFIDPDDVPLPANKREDFILIPGEEITGRRHIHTTGMNTARFVPPSASEKASDTETPPDILQMHVDSIRQAGGAPILNHPNFISGIHAHDILKVKRLHMFELYNGHPDVHNWGNELQASYKTDARSAYLRCRLSYRRKNAAGGYERFFAWTQPRFFDGRAEGQ